MSISVTRLRAWDQSVLPTPDAASGVPIGAVASGTSIPNSYSDAPEARAWLSHQAQISSAGGATWWTGDPEGRHAV